MHHLRPEQSERQWLARKHMAHRSGTGSGVISERFMDAPDMTVALPRTRLPNWKNPVPSSVMTNTQYATYASSLIHSDDTVSAYR